MKKLLFLSITLMLASCSGNKEDKKNIQKATINHAQEHWINYSTKDSIPYLFREALVNLNNGNFKLADPNERFNAIDIINDSLPGQKLQLISQSGNKWRLTYIQGGFVKYYVFAQCEIKNDSIYNFQVAESVLILAHNDSIDKYISENKLKPKNITLNNKNIIRKSI